MKILLTGATGFLGSHIAEVLIQKGNQLICTKRTTSSLQNCSEFSSHITWINIDQADWEDQVVDFAPTHLIHSAWSGVAASGRDSWKEQLTNIDFLVKLLLLSKRCGVQKFISLGSQAEYGPLTEAVCELAPVNPQHSYGALKVSSLERLKSFCESVELTWYWIRVFSVFGERESTSWFIPSVITALLKNQESIDLTACEQKYAYLYVRDFAESISCTLEKEAPSGVYNLSSNHAISLKVILETIKEELKSTTILKYGAIPYRTHQSMRVEGVCSKFNTHFGEIDATDFELKLKQTIDYYRKQLTHESN